MDYTPEQLREQAAYYEGCTGGLGSERDWMLALAAKIEECEGWRELLAFTYGVTYGDDGELQNNAGYPPIDFKRDSLEQIKAAIVERNIAALKEPK